MKNNAIVFSIMSLVLLCLMSSGAIAQDTDSLIVTNSWIPPGDSGYISIYLRNEQFAVSGFSVRLELDDTLYASLDSVIRGSSVMNFDYFNFRKTNGAIKIVGVADMPAGGSPPPLPRGYHELARVLVKVSQNCPPGFSDSLLFRNDTLPPDRDNSISDSTGYINSVPELKSARIVFEALSGGIADAATLPDSPELLPNYPNPFNAQTTIAFRLPAESDDISLNIFDILGRHVKSFYWGHLSVGEHSVVWDGISDSREAVSSGIYLFTLSSPAFKTGMLKMTLLK